MPTIHTGPAASERALIAVWDLVDQTRLSRGERIATAIAECALEAARQASEIPWPLPQRAKSGALSKESTTP